MSKSALIIGGGFFGCSMALMLRELGLDVVVLERSDELLTRASRVNQARVHGGYHYPRSLMTAFRSRHNYEKWREAYRPAICDKFTKLYSVGKTFSKVTASQFELFMKRIGAPLKEASPAQQKLMNWDLVEGLWVAEECAFDYSILRDIVRSQMEESGVVVHFNADAKIISSSEKGLRLELADGRGFDADWVFNATYSGVNRLGGDVERVPLKHELAEMALVDLPDELRGLSMTMMCGPFFSFMPYPAEGLTSLSHVRYTPHAEWYESVHGEDPVEDPYERFEKVAKVSNFQYMVADAARFMPALEGCRYSKSIWEVKTLLPKSEADDGRPILFRRDGTSPNLVHVMGGKIDNIFDVGEELKPLIKNSL